SSAASELRRSPTAPAVSFFASPSAGLTCHQHSHSIDYRAITEPGNRRLRPASQAVFSSRRRHPASPSISIIAAQIHALIQRSHLFGIAVEHQRVFARSEYPCAYAPFGRLAPAWMGHIWIDVGIKAILVRGDLHPTGHR